jgi:hypothetical protein
MKFYLTNSRPSLIKAGMLSSFFVLIVLGFFSISAEQTTTIEANKQSAEVSAETRHPMLLAQKNLEQAQKNFKLGDIEAVKQNLQEAKIWLENSQSSKNAKSNEEAKKLANEIAGLEKQLSNSTDQNESTLSRLWHRSTALVEHELQLVSKHWSEASIANQAYKHILDARLHFNYAEHELFVSHDSENARHEIKQTLDYLEKAKKAANPAVSKQIELIHNEIDALSNTQIDQTEKQKLAMSLDSARKTLEQASKNSGPLIESEIKTIGGQIEKLKSNLDDLLSRQHFQSIMSQLHKLDSEL